MGFGAFVFLLPTIHSALSIDLGTMKSVVTFLSLAAVASAHFLLDYPLTRGFDEDLEPSASFSLSWPLDPPLPPLPRYTTAR